MVNNKTFIVWGAIIVLVITALLVHSNLSNNSKNDNKEYDSSLVMSDPLIKENADCELVEYCGNLAKVDCVSAADGPLFYVNKLSGKIVEYCGGYCQFNDPSNPYCNECPPAAWNCG